MILFLFVSCTTLPPAVPVCVEINPVKGYCVNIITGESFEVTEDKKFEGKTWWAISPTMVQMPASSWAKIKSYIIKQCKITGKCQKSVASWERTVEVVDESLAKKGIK